MTPTQIPKNLQVDAVLTGKTWNLVHRFCDGVWGDLSTRWTVGFDEIVEEAKRRGLESFISARPIAEGHCFVTSETGYTVFYFERGTRMYFAQFEDLEPAFIYWLDQELRAHLLPGRTEP